MSSPSTSPSASSSNNEAVAVGLDQQQLEALFVRLEKRVFNVVYRWLFEREEAADVVQDAFCALWGMRERVQLDTVEPLLFRIAINRAAKRRRWKKLRALFSATPTQSEAAFRDSADPAPAAEATLAQADDVANLRRAVDALPEKLRQVLVLCELSELSYQDVARCLELAPGTVASRRHQAMVLLRARMHRLEAAQPARPVQEQSR